MEQKAGASFRHVFGLPIIVAALGYFVDIYDLVLFSIVRVPSLKARGLSGKDVTDYGVFLLNMQMAGMLIGGTVWGVLGDRKGKLKSCSAPSSSIPLQTERTAWSPPCLRRTAFHRRHRTGRRVGGRHHPGGRDSA